MCYSSNMLEALPSPTAKPRLPDPSPACPAHLTHSLLARLTDRNLINQNIIRKYIKKMEKKTWPPASTLPSLGKHLLQTAPTEQPEGGGQDAVEEGTGWGEKMCVTAQNQKDGVEREQQSDEGDGCGAVQVQIAETKETIDSEPPPLRTHNFPLLDCPHPHPTPKDPPSHRYNKDLTHYFKNLAYRQTNSNNDHIKPDSTLLEFPRHSIHGRLQSINSISQQKYQLSIKSLIFGSEEVTRKVETDGNRKNCRVPTDSNDRYRSNDKAEDRLSRGEFEDGNLLNRGILPTLSQIKAHRSRKCLQNFIKLTQERSKEKPKLGRIPVQVSCLPQSAPRIGLSFRINTIPIRKQY